MHRHEYFICVLKRNLLMANLYASLYYAFHRMCNNDKYTLNLNLTITVT